MILQDPGVGMKDCQVWQPIEQVFLMDAAGSVSPDDGSAALAAARAPTRRSSRGDGILGIGQIRLPLQFGTDIAMAQITVDPGRLLWLALASGRRDRGRQKGLAHRLRRGCVSTAF
jgi:hypothetical protein